LINSYKDDDVVFSWYNKFIFKDLEVNPVGWFSPASKLVNAADAYINEKLANGSYLAVQWRMEKSHVTWMPSLIPAMLNIIGTVMKEKQWTHVRPPPVRL